MDTKSGKPPLSLRRNLLLCSYVAKLATQPHHSSHDAVFSPTFHSRYESNITTSQPVGVCFPHLIQWHNIRLLSIIPYGLSDTYLQNLSTWTATSDSSDIQRMQHHPSFTAGVFWIAFILLWPHGSLYWQAISSWIKQALLSYVMARYFPIVCIILIAFSLLNCMPFIKLICLSGASLSSIISFTQTP